MNQVEVKRRQIQLCSHCLGLLTIWFLGSRIGDNGLAYLAAALEGFYILWSFTGCTLPDALGRALRSKNAKGQYRNAAGMKRNTLLLEGLLGVIGSLLFICCAGIFSEKLFHMPYSRVAMLVLAPVISLRTLQNVLLGYFHGEGSELPTAVVCVLRQILLLILSLWLCGLFGAYGAKVSALLGAEQFTAMYQIIGIALAVVLAELMLLLFLLVVYKGSRYSRHKKEGEGMKTVDSLGGQLGAVYRYKGVAVLLQLLEGLPLWLGLIFYQKQSAGAQSAVNAYGIYSGKYLVLCGLIILFGGVLIIGINAKSYGMVRREEQRNAKELFQAGLKLILIHGFFFAVFIAILSKQLTGVLRPNDGGVLMDMLSYGSSLIVFLLVGFLGSRMLLLLGRAYYVCLGAGIADIVFVVLAVVLLNGGKLGILALVYAGIAYAAVYAVFTGFMVCRELHMGIDILRTLVIPLGCASVIGLVCLMLGKVFTPHLGNGVTVLVCLILGGMLYWAMLMLLRCFDEREAELLPGGRIIRAIGQLLHIF